MIKQHPKGLRPVQVSNRWWQSTGPAEDRGWKFDLIGEAWFHQLGVACEESDNGFGNYTIAVIEWPDGRLDTVAPHGLKFLDVEQEGVA